MNSMWHHYVGNRSDEIINVFFNSTLYLLFEIYQIVWFAFFCEFYQWMKSFLPKTHRELASRNANEKKG